MNLYDLDEQLLNVWVAKAEGHMIATLKHGDVVTGYSLYFYSGDTPPIPKYTTDARLADPIIEREGITILHLPTFGKDYAWRASHPNMGGSRGGPNKLTASMRAFVDSKYGDELPNEV